MKIQYTFTADLEDVQEILFQKYSRVYNRNDLGEIHKKLKVSYLEKTRLEEIRKMLTIYKDALASVYSEVEEELKFITELTEALTGQNKVDNVDIPESTKEKSLLSETKETSQSIQELTNMLSSFGKAENQHE
jgi:GTP1/Obg family GTP-binding protein